MRSISPYQRSLIVALGIGALAACSCLVFRQRVFPGPGDFNWALNTAQALISGQDPYNFVPSALHVPYPLPVALFGLPFLPLPKPLAGALFFGLSSGLLAYGILRSGQPWRLMIFLTFPYFYALIFAQWSPLVMATWFFPTLAPLLVLVKPQIALPIAINRITRPGLLLAAAVLLGSLLISPTWPWRWLSMTQDYERIIPLLTLPFGPLLLIALYYWRDDRARLLVGISALPFRGAYDLVALWLLPGSAKQMIILVGLGWLIPLYDFSLGISVRPAWVVPMLFIPSLVLLIINKFRERQLQSAMLPAPSLPEPEPLRSE